MRSISDGSTTYYLNDPDGNTFQGIYTRVTSTNPAAPGVGNYVVFTGLTQEAVSIRVDDDSTLFATAGSYPMVLSREVGVLGATRRPGSLHKGGVHPLVAVSAAITLAFASAFVVARTQTCP